VPLCQGGKDGRKREAKKFPGGAAAPSPLLDAADALGYTYLDRIKIFVDHLVFVMLQ